MEENSYEVVEMILLPDDYEWLKKELIRLSDDVKVDLILTSGGTEFSSRDNAPEATMEVSDRNAPRIAEYMRFKSMMITDRGMLSRRICNTQTNFDYKFTWKSKGGKRKFEFYN